MKLRVSVPQCVRVTESAADIDAALASAQMAGKKADVVAGMKRVVENLREYNDEANRLREALALSAPLAAAYHLKEDLRRFWKKPHKDQARRFLEGWIERARATGIRQLRQIPGRMSSGDVDS